MKKFECDVRCKTCKICGEPTEEHFSYCSDCWTSYIDTSNCASCDWRTNDSIICNDRCPYAYGQLESSKSIAIQIAILKEDQQTIVFCQN